MVSSTLWMAINERAQFRCEWIYPDLTRCQNVMSLQGHHKTYERFGDEIESDLSLLCPAHHFIADMVRKKFVGQPTKIIFERLRQVQDKKLSKMDQKTQRKYLARMKREGDIFWDSIFQAQEASRKIDFYQIDDNDWRPTLGKEELRLILWHDTILFLCTDIYSKDDFSFLCEATQEMIEETFS